MRARLGDGARRVQVVYVTVDPERDTSARLRAYTEQFDRTIVGLTGSREQLAAIWKAYGVSVTRREVPDAKAPVRRAPLRLGVPDRPRPADSA